MTERVDPDVVALELPGIALAPVERAARAHREDGTPLDDEMSAAVAAGDGARLAGIDAPGRSFLRQFLGAARREGALVGAVGRAVAATAGAARSAVSWRLGAGRRSPSPGQWGPGSGFEYDVTGSDPPEAQASDERAVVGRSRSLLGAIERPPATRLIDDARERAMASRLDDLRREGAVVAVVGVDHLDAVAGSVGGSPAGD